MFCLLPSNGRDLLPSATLKKNSLKTLGSMENIEYGEKYRNVSPSKHEIFQIFGVIQGSSFVFMKDINYKFYTIAKG